MSQLQDCPILVYVALKDEKDVLPWWDFQESGKTANIATVTQKGTIAHCASTFPSQNQ